MTLGKTITALRTRHGLSQGELAEKLNVSRQAVSKWETNASIPELDKLIALSGLFSLTLDELVKGQLPQAGNDSPTPTATDPQTPGHPRHTGHTRTIVGIILLCFGALVLLLLTVLGGFLSGLLFAAPFLLCGAACLIFRKNTALWCFWALLFAVDVYLRYATGITWQLTLLTLHYEPSMNYLRLAFAWAELLCFLAMLVLTVLRFSKHPLSLTRRAKGLYLAGWLVFALLFLPVHPAAQPVLSRLLYLFLDWCKLGLFTALLTTTVRLVKTGRQKKRRETP